MWSVDSDGTGIVVSKTMFIPRIEKAGLEEKESNSSW